ncbi:TonB-dependent receptor [Caulobacter flavus]|uniref:TonB-dependent receptor n=1 Tax=Caulobacter flavus TaxID=1679497 RepID=A0A2N5CRP2_9CAUL|nr:TonB-dependent receptor [Caulobacter flavus]AYV46537.1 TonB-dependent receptor [Caulobacter flavus]PLR12195.1 TonB-dependent receptor [Caulobacter flavus]
MTSNRNPRLRAVLGASASAFTILAAGAAIAQEAPPPAAEPASDEVEAIVVTGFRASLQSAINLKRNESGVVDAIKAEDIAQFPDLNLAESLQRIPGVSISRINGEGRQITVRGLGSEYTRVRINGMEAISTTGGTANSGGTNRGRGFDFNVFASDLFNSIAVRKTASADVEEGSLGATVDLTTAKAFDSGKPQLVLSAGASYNDLSEKTTPRVSVLASNVFFDGKVGALLSVAYEERHLKEEGANITRWATGASNGGFNSASTVPGYTVAQINSANIFAPRIPGYVSYDIESKRLGIAGSLQYKPNSDTQVTLDALYAYLAGTRKEAQLQAIGLSRANTGKPQTIIRDGVVENGNLVYARMDNVDLRTQAAYDELNTEFKQFTLSGTHDFSGSLRVGMLAGYSDSTFTQPISTIVTFDRANSQNYQYDFRKGRAPQILLGFDPTDPANWASTNGTSEVRIRPQFVENQFSTAKVYGEWDLNENLRLKAGLDWRKFEYDSYGQYRTSETVVQTLTPAQLASVSKVFTGFGRNMDLPEGNFTSWLIPDIDKYAALLGIYSNSGIYALTDTNNSSARGQYGAVEEQDYGAYVQAEFKFDAFGLPFRGDAGVRRVHTEQESAGYAAVAGAIQRVDVARDYDLTLPSFNLAADLSDTVVARVSAAQTIARPGIGSLSPGGDVAVQGANRTYSSGNPYLTPTKSDNLDFSLEWYREKGAMIALGVFYKRIDTFVATLRREAVYNTLGLPDSLLTGTGATTDQVFQVTQPVNSDGGDLKGFEINIQQPFTFLPGFWSNFGVVANYTYVDSKIEYLTSTTPGAPTVNATLVGLSKNAANLTLYYETPKWSVRGSLAYRDGYLTQVPGSDGNTVQGTNETLNVDMQASWNIRDNLKLSIEGVNLTDEFNDQYVGDSNRLNVYTHSGRQFLVGLRYNF